jgi:hypothetical protein
MGLFGGQVCTSRNSETHSGTIKTKNTINHAVTDESINILDKHSNNINDNIVTLVRYKNSFLKEVILTVEYCTVNRWYELRYLYKVNFATRSGRLDKKYATVEELDKYYTEEKIDEELSKIVVKRSLVRYVGLNLHGQIKFWEY